MRAMSSKMGFSVLVVALVAAVVVSVGWTKQASSSPDKAEIERGRYLVEDVAMCGECHTPRNAQGELNRNAWLQGAPIWIMPVKTNHNWAPSAPALAGFPSFTEQEGERILERGIGPEGETLRPPMHIYHMKHEDAVAIIAYLKSLPLPRH
jgi:mono/diheme cytochrome c family protein